MIDKTVAQRYVDAVERNNLGVRTRLPNRAVGNCPDRRPGRCSLGRVALWYARRGVPVFPCTARDKSPLGRKGFAPNGFKDATTDPARIREWWTAEPDANIGSPTGVTFDVIDLDGNEAIASTYGEGVTLPAETGHAITPRPGGHHVFIAPTGAGNRVNIYPAVDYRGRGGYVLLAPSVGANGRRYQWTRPLDLKVAA